MNVTVDHFLHTDQTSSIYRHGSIVCKSDDGSDVFDASYNLGKISDRLAGCGWDDCSADSDFRSNPGGTTPTLLQPGQRLATLRPYNHLLILAPGLYMHPIGNSWIVCDPTGE